MQTASIIIKVLFFLFGWNMLRNESGRSAIWRLKRTIADTVCWRHVRWVQSQTAKIPRSKRNKNVSVDGMTNVSQQINVALSLDLSDARSSIF